MRLVLIAVIPMALALSGCAMHYHEGAFISPYGFFSGIWHGVIAPISIAINICSWLLSIIGINLLNDIQIMGRPNTGFGYYVGFIIGLYLFGSAGSYQRQ